MNSITFTSAIETAGRRTPAETAAPGFWDLVREDLATHEGDWTRPGFRALFTYRVGVFRFRAPGLLRRSLTLLYRLMHRHVRNSYGIELHYSAKLGRRVKIAHQGAIVIHEFAVIGDDCILRQGVTVGAGTSWDAKTAPVLGDRVDVGAGAKILGKIKVGDNSRVGPNVVLMTDLPANSICFVEPPRVMRRPGTKA